jgi:hypothetical protein
LAHAILSNRTDTPEFIGGEVCALGEKFSEIKSAPPTADAGVDAADG